MTLLSQDESSGEYSDAEISALIASPDLNFVRTGTNSNPPCHRVSSSPPPYESVQSAQNLTPDDSELAELISSLQIGGTRPSPPATPTRSRRIYEYSSPVGTGVTTEWSVAGTASQGIAHGSVHTLERKSKRSHGKKGGYVVFHGRCPAVCSTWAEARKLVDGVLNSIHRGYRTLAEAHAAFKYAEERGWTRACDSQDPATAIHVLPTPILPSDIPNPLHGSETTDSQWFVVYRGITPGVYQSILEALLNTVGVRASVYEGVEGRGEAIEKYHAAISRGDVAAVLPANLCQYHISTLAFGNDVLLVVYFMVTSTKIRIGEVLPMYCYFPYPALSSTVTRTHHQLLPQALFVIYDVNLTWSRHFFMSAFTSQAKVGILTEYQLKRRAELKERSQEEQELHAERARAHQAKYREKRYTSIHGPDNAYTWATRLIRRKERRDVEKLKKQRRLRREARTAAKTAATAPCVGAKTAAQKRRATASDSDPESDGFSDPADASE
ncbi:hypothetical protein C8J57DRAFT_1255243 [Mycena rebaudengoi]|nr:hypothetical protein C8J57DRAFT_1255243 [Mycena rebaudengoi]